MCEEMLLHLVAWWLMWTCLPHAVWLLRACVCGPLARVEQYLAGRGVWGGGGTEYKWMGGVGVLQMENMLG
jgi:hypothetical protein